MQSAKPRVSIGMPVYNGEQFIANALDSLLAQTFTDFEIVISDNASTDRTLEICQAYAARDTRIRVFRSDTNRGASWNHNRVFELSSGEYFKWASHDDMCAPEMIAKCVDVLDRDPSVVLCYAKTKIVDAAGALIQEYECVVRSDSPEPAARFGDLVCVPHHCYQVYGVIRSAALRKTPLIGYYISSDRALLAWLGLLGRFHEIPEYLFISRKHPQQSNAIKLHKRAAWYDTGRIRQITLPRWRLVAEYLRAIRETGLSAYDRRLCYLQLARWAATNWNWARLGRDVLEASIQVLRSSMRPLAYRG